MSRHEHLTRQLEIIPLECLTQKITIIGAGAIGSFAALSLAKMGFADLQVWDFDEVSVENMNCQWYRFADIGKPKVLALEALIKDFTGVEIEARNERYETQDLKGILITAVDSMAVRKQIFERLKAGNYGVNWLIDPRMASEAALQYVINPWDRRDRETYEKVLYTDAHAVAERCTAKATMYTATMIAGYVAKAVKDIVTKKPYARVTHWNIADNHLQNWTKETLRAEA